MQKSRSALVAGIAIVSVFVTLVACVPPSVATVPLAARNGGAARLSRARAGTVVARVALSPNVVTVNASTVASNLLSASSDGSTYVFKSASGSLSQLAPGKVMLLQGYAVAVVVSVSRSGSRLTVTTRPAALTDIFKTADLNFSEPIDFADAFGTLEPGSPPSEATSEARADEPQVALAAAGKPVIPNVGLSYVGKGTNDFSYRISVSPTLSRLNWAIQGCVGASFITGQTCVPGKSAGGLTLEATLSGYIAKANLAGSFDIVNGRNLRSTFSFLSVGGVAITYQILDPGKNDFKLPVLRLPMSFNVPFAIAGVPMLLKVSFALLVNVALSSKNSTIQGGETLTYGGSESVTESGGSDSGATNPMSVKGSFVTNKPSVTLSSAAVEVASQMKVGFGPGLAAGNILGYGDVIVAIGQRTGTLVAGLPCSAFYLTVSGHAYMEAQVAVWRIASKPVELFSKSYTDPRAEC
ncbi:MAG: hypothetical protein ABSB52_02415 [Acidimicrobiales bacterium]|jgi:hypothetical protein